MNPDLSPIPSVTRLVLSSGTPTYRDPYRKVGTLTGGHAKSALLEDPVPAVGEVGMNALLGLLHEFIERAGGEVAVAESGPPSERPRKTREDEALHPLVREAAKRVRQLSDQRVCEQAVDALQRLSERLPLQAPDAVATLVVSVFDDGSVIIEWPMPGRRAGFSVSPEASESGWFFVSSKDCGNIMASGALAEAPMEQIVEWALGNLPTK